VKRGLSYSRLRKRLLFIRMISNAISVLLHPLLMPTLLFTIIVNYLPMVVSPINEEGKKYLIGLTFVTTFLFPVFISLTFLLMIKNRFSIRDLFLDENKERFIPFLSTGILYVGVTYVMYSTIRLNPVCILIMTGISITVLMVAVITLFWKISAHAAGISGVVGYLLYFSILSADNNLFIPVAVLILLSGILLSARLYLRSHTSAQVYAGYLLGLFISFVTMYLTLLQKY
jgi:membrane-associated phospholipid phosphatase